VSAALQQPMPGQSTKKNGRRGSEKLRAFHEEEVIGKAYDGRLLRRLYPFLKPHMRFLVLSLVTLLVVNGLGLLNPIIMGNVVSHASSGDSAGLLHDGVYLLLVLIATQVLTFAQTYTMQLAGARAMSDLRTHIFLFFQRLQLRYFDRTPVGRLVTRGTNDVDTIGDLFASGGLNAMGDLVSLLGIIVMMLLLDFRIALIAFAAMPVVGIIVNVVRKRSRAAYRDIRAKTARLNSFLNEQVNGISVVQAYGRERETAEEFDEINEAYRAANKASIYYEAIMDAAIEMVSTVCIASILWWAGVRGAGMVTFPLLVTFTQYIKQFFQPISMLSQRYTLLQSAMAGAERIFQLLDEKQLDEPEREDKECAPAGADDEAIAFVDVGFEYKPGAPVLKDVSLSAKRGEKIALVGATGAGKTTVASLALRLYEVNEGYVRVLGKDVRRYDRHALRENFSVVPQDVYLFAGTVLSNVAMSDPEPDRARAEEALRRIGAYELFMRRGKGEKSGSGLDAQVDERGANFSAGERQLIAFARAVYRDAPILILDEATASVDSDTEAKLQTALEAVMKDRTALVIAHRLSTIKAVDRIVVFHKGRVVESGTHDELLARGGVYARLYRMQFAHERAKELEARTAEVEEGVI
jgi:ATP-binding cassette subfamily B multidrug efflux pump